MYCYRLLTILCLLALPGWVSAQDPGVRDTLRIEAATIRVGISSPVKLTIVNDSAIISWDAALLLQTLDTAFARFDSVRFVGRLADPSIEPQRIINRSHADGISPDTLIIACLRGAGQMLPPGNDALIEIYLTGIKPGFMLIDTSIASPSGADFVPATTLGAEYIPVFAPVIIEVINPGRPPEIALNDSATIIATTSDQIEIELIASSPGGHPLELQLGRLEAADDPTRTPLSQPMLSPAGLFTWNPGAADVGIWTVEFKAVDTTGVSSTVRAEIQILTSSDFMVEFARDETPQTPIVTSLGHGDFDNDGQLDFVMSALPDYSGSTILVYSYNGDGQLNRMSALQDDFYERNLSVAYLDTDDHLDVVLLHAGQLRILRGSGTGAFTIDDNQPLIRDHAIGASLTNLDGDAFLDYVVVSKQAVVVYRGTATGFEEAIEFEPGDEALAVNSADFNNDGWDDLAIGTRSALEIYLNDGDGGYRLAETYPQEYGTVDIDVTSQGSDFNNDGIFDLCLATPSVGGEFSELMIYLGYGDGSFEPLLVRRVKGQIFASRAGDFNGDAELDIAFINGARNYLSIVFGNGRGEFLNERRYDIPRFKPRRLDCADVDNDGDLDLLVAAYVAGLNNQSSIFMFRNQLNPIGVMANRFEVMAGNNAQLEIVSPGGGRLNQFVNSLASGDLYAKNLDDDSLIDAVAISRTVEPGRYDLRVMPKPNLQAGTPFSLTYSIDGQTFRIATDQPMLASGFSFPIYPDGNSPIRPRQGEFIQTALPTFVWESNGVERFELARDIGFNDIIESATVSTGLYTPQLVLPDTDSTAYFWRVRSETGTELTPVQAFNVVRTPTDAEEIESPASLPDSCRLSQNYPNPFNPKTTVEYYLPDGARVSITIHNVLGQLIRTLVDQFVPSGTYTVEWDATDLHCRAVASGIYFYRMEVGDFASTRKMVLVR